MPIIIATIRIGFEYFRNSSVTCPIPRAASRKGSAKPAEYTVRSMTPNFTSPVTKGMVKMLPKMGPIQGDQPA